MGLGDNTSSSSSSDEGERETRHHSRAGGGRGARKSQAILPRPSASSGGWLCFLMPLAFATRYLHTPPCDATADLHKLLTVAATGICVETLCFFVYMFVDTGILIKCLISLLPGAITSVIYVVALDTSWAYALAAGFLITVLYQHCYICVLRALPYTFSFGEAAVLVQGLVLFVLNATYRLYELLVLETKPLSDFDQLNAIMLNALISLLIFCVLLAVVRPLRKPVPFYLSLAVLAVVVTCTPVTKPLPLIALLNFIFREQKRLNILVFYFTLVGLTAATVGWQLRNSRRASTRVRKIFHLLIDLVFIPGIVYQCALLYISTGIALAVFTVLELFRLLEVPPFAARLKDAFNSFKDEKDAGRLALTPFCLLIGCSLPIWLTPCPCDAVAAGNTLALLSGILAVGVGDTAASVVGSKLGRIKWGKSNRSVEGTIAFVVSVLLATLLLQLTGFLPMTQAKWFATVFAALNTGLVEAFTDQVDNLVLPLIFYILVGLA
ncbi:dolichol kinase [Scaptodrosophila lebanonensis]|uniref:dolichol kinase n=1 Tax=Drosophila lebanonensis TaxID=7225 RepID=A0A6J2UAJ8_DROLE|nr:dolichol kinase [Scaptodrosophila lebanonensis]